MHANLALGEQGLIDRLQNRGDAGKVLVGPNGSALDEELVAAFGVRRRVLLHSLEKNLHRVSVALRRRGS